MSTVRQAVIGDLLEIASIDRAVFGADAYPALFFRQAHELWPELLQIAIHEGAPVGYGLGAVASDRSGWILSVAVREAVRGRGTGALLARTLVAAFARHGVSALRLTVHPGNASARGLYERLGFTVEREEEGYYGEGEPRLVMLLERFGQGRRVR